MDLDATSEVLSWHTTEVPFDRTATVYERNGVTISSFPVIHILNGAVGYRLDYAGGDRQRLAHQPHHGRQGVRPG